MKIRYTDIDGYFGYGKLYEEIIEKCPEGETIVELGAFHGRSTSYLLELANKSGKNINIVIIDHFNGSAEHKGLNVKHYDLFMSNINNLEFSYPHVVMREDSSKAAAKIADKSVYFVMIDASHDYENVKQDILTWMPKIKNGGILSGDDYDWDGVKRAVDEVVVDVNIYPRAGGNCCTDIYAGNYWTKNINEN